MDFWSNAQIDSVATVRKNTPPSWNATPSASAMLGFVGTPTKRSEDRSLQEPVQQLSSLLGHLYHNPVDR
eukprot:356800-Rhodomonas_salina.2